MSQPGDLFGTHTPLPRLRSDLVISPQKYRGTTSYVIKDPVGLRYYRLGTYELQVAGLLNGQRTLTEVTEQLQEQLRDRTVDQATVLRIVTHFAQMSFLQLSGESANRLFALMADSRKKQKTLQRIMGVAGALVYFKFSLFDPDLLLLKAEKRIRWLWSKTTAIVLATVVSLALVLVFQNGSRISDRLPDFLTLHNLVWLWVTLIGVKVVHEFGHALMCKHYGGEVHDLGAMFIILTPFLFCDATDSWMFQNKWHKILVNLAGILVELILASLAVFVWVVTPPGLINQLAFNAMVVCSVSTVIFNANPLMKFDGYYVLADLLEIPNLRERASKQVTGFMTRLVTGRATPGMTEMSPARSLIFGLYSVASYLYVWFIMIRIFGGIGRKLEPYGLGWLGKFSLLSTYGAGIGIPIYFFIKRLLPTLRQTGFRINLPGRTAKVIGGILLAGLVLAVWPRTVQVTTSCVLAGTNRRGVRAQSDGFVRNILVKEGQFVQRGQALATLENDDLVTRLANQESQLQIVELRRQSASALNDSAGVNLHTKEAAVVTGLLTALRQRCVDLQLTAPVAGVVLSADLDADRGLFLPEGSLFCEILPAGQINVMIALTEDQAGLVQPGQPVDLRIYALPSQAFHGTVKKTFHATSGDLPHPALAGRFGGEVPTELDLTGRERPVETLCLAELQIENPDNFLRPGMSGRARIVCGPSTIGRMIGRKLRSLVRLDFQF